MKSWFGKNCKYFVGKWEENEIIGGLDYKDYEPILIFCNHSDNSEDTEGNCYEKICPLGLKEK